MITTSGEEAVAVTCSAARRPFRMPTHNDRHTRLLHRLRIRLHRPPLVEAAGERLRGFLPERTNGLDRLLGALGALLEGNPQGRELLAQPTNADTEQGAAAGENIERRHLLGD